MPATDDIANVRTIVWDYYHDHGRHDMPWRRDDYNPYFIMVSEIMLQQTQVSRVFIKFNEFIETFPTVESLAAAPQSEVLITWSGLGYNRRAKFLHQAAQMIVGEYNGSFPRSVNELVRLPGIGVNTAGAIMAYACNDPVVFVETNIRTVIIHHFFSDDSAVPDKAILAVAEELLDREHPREWYWALMDYGTYLKQAVGNLNRQSKSYAKQSKFEGSRRQIRGQVLRELAGAAKTSRQLAAAINDERLETVIHDLLREGLIAKKGTTLSL